jgi:hypothetical protein
MRDLTINKVRVFSKDLRDGSLSNEGTVELKDGELIFDIKKETMLNSLKRPLDEFKLKPEEFIDFTFNRFAMSTTIVLKKEM